MPLVKRLETRLGRGLAKVKS
jgi:hypothetical protein